MKPYPEYKESGVEWLSKIPNHWELMRTKYVAELNMGQSPSSDEYNDVGNGVPFLQGNAEFGELNPIPKQYTTSIKKIAEPNDLLISVRAPVGALNIADQLYGIGRGLCAIKPKSSFLENSFCWYQFHHYRFQLYQISTGSTYEAVSAEDVGNMIIVIPPLSEQHTIAAYLDRETSRIDSLITKKQRQIELLQEKRSALISHVVTKGLPAEASAKAGLDPDVRMKDSGVEWLGEVPEHWELRRLKNIVNINPQKSEIKNISENTLVSFVPMESVYEYGGLNINLNKTINECFNGYTYFRDNDVLVAKITPCFENYKGAIARNLTNGIGFGTTELHVLRTSKDIISEYLFIITMSRQFRKLGEAWMYGAAGQKRISEEFISNVIFPIPSMDEQIQIIKYINGQLNSIDRLVRIIDNSIIKLREYRTALISAAVTGKIDVRDEVAGEEVRIAAEPMSKYIKG